MAIVPVINVIEIILTVKPGTLVEGVVPEAGEELVGVVVVGGGVVVSVGAAVG